MYVPTQTVVEIVHIWCNGKHTWEVNEYKYYHYGRLNKHTYWYNFNDYVDSHSGSYTCLNISRCVTPTCFVVWRFVLFIFTHHFSNTWTYYCHPNIFKLVSEQVTNHIFSWHIIMFESVNWRVCDQQWKKHLNTQFVVRTIAMVKKYTCDLLKKR